MPQMNLENETLALLHAERGKRSQELIAREAGVGYPWLMKFSRGKFGSAGVKTVQRLHDYLVATRNSTKRGKARGSARLG